MKVKLDTLTGNINSIIFEHLAKGESISIDLVGTLVPKNYFVDGDAKSVKKVVTLQSEIFGDKLIDLIGSLALEAEVDNLELFNNWYHSCLVSNSNEVSIFKVENTVTVIVNKADKTVEIIASKELQKYLNPMNISDSKMKIRKLVGGNKSMRYYIWLAVIIFPIATVAIFFDEIFPERGERNSYVAQMEEALEDSAECEEGLEVAEEVAEEVAAEVAEEVAEAEVKVVKVTEPVVIAKPVVAPKPVVVGSNGHLPVNTRFLVLGSFLSSANAKTLKNSINFEKSRLYIGYRGRMNLVMVALESTTVLTSKESQIKNDYEGSWYFMNR